MVGVRANCACEGECRSALVREGTLDSPGERESGTSERDWFSTALLHSRSHVRFADLMEKGIDPSRADECTRCFSRSLQITGVQIIPDHSRSVERPRTWSLYESIRVYPSRSMPILQATRKRWENGDDAWREREWWVGERERESGWCERVV